MKLEQFRREVDSAGDKTAAPGQDTVKAIDPETGDTYTVTSVVGETIDGKAIVWLHLQLEG